MNRPFLEKFSGPTGTGFVVFYGDRIAADVGTASMHDYSIQPVEVSNTSSLPEGTAEAWITGPTRMVAGPYFPQVRFVHFTEQEAQQQMNYFIADEVAWRRRQIAAFESDIAHLSKFASKEPS